MSDELTKLLAEEYARKAELSNAIGELCQEFSHVEGYLNWAITCLLDTTERRGQVVCSAIRNVSTRLDIYSGLIQVIKMSDDAKKALKATVTEITRLNAYRNQLLHNRWGVGNMKVWLDMNRGSVKFKHREFKPDDIRAEAQNCIQCVVSISQAIKLYQDSVAKDRAQDGKEG